MREKPVVYIITMHYYEQIGFLLTKRRDYRVRFIITTHADHYHRQLIFSVITFEKIGRFSTI
jgi:hypothetical protein